MKQKELTALMTAEARRWLGVIEEGQNSGQLINLMQQSVGIEDGDSWCMAYIQFCLQAVQRQVKALSDAVTLSIPTSGHCLTVWGKTPSLYRYNEPRVGTIVIWQHGDTQNGHTGWVTDVDGKGFFACLEGNTSKQGTNIDRNGGEVCYKKRHISGAGSMKVVGFIDPFITVKQQVQVP
jgi:hypothetical protein